ncbi:amino acid ABC transporter substrate-binding protein [Pseudoalteromonas sp. MM1]|jgi:polar amino acid transport system substrate-binding protein|uniref:substrate-binding periplasmic protein n=1 Tax=Pseudoalteromonas sp. MM1 TaxID=3036714 RepID=UPI0025726867|nr:transporter substrate-binding domain-containing protein [Pseudoalteromonas sp. MM1]BED91285.1 amino acid ABC transporter substrate-binding protein [Pseudoalteromonas sp. MM1]
MRVLLIFILFSSYCFAQVPITYIQNDTRRTVIGERYKSGYLFNAPNSVQTIHVVTLDWPPYIGNKLCNKGWVYQFSVAVLNSVDYSVYIEFVPWARAVRAVELGKADILMPEYYIEDTAPSDYVAGQTRRKLLGLSNSFEGGNIGFLKRKGEPDRFNGNLKSLKGSRIGVVRGYQNTPEFDAMMDNNEFIIIDAVDDLQLVNLLVAKRVDLIIGDLDVLIYSVKYASLANSEKQALLSAIEPESKVIQYNPLYFAISKSTPNWLTVLENINTGLYKFKNSGETQRLKNTLLNECDKL